MEEEEKDSSQVEIIVPSVVECIYTKEILESKSMQDLRDACESLRFKIKKTEELLKGVEDERSCLMMQVDARYVAIDQLLDLCTYGTRDLDYYFRSVQMSVVIP